MIRFSSLQIPAVLIALMLFVIPASQLFAQDQAGLQGWEINSEYNSLYNSKELDRIKGVITKFVEVTPMEGMAPGTALYLDEGDGEKILVHLCPAAYAEADKTGLRKGVETKIRGSWAVIGDQDVFIASKAKQGEHFEFKVRLTSDGTPFWTMSPEQLAKELASN